MKHFDSLKLDPSWLWRTRAHLVLYIVTWERCTPAPRVTNLIPQSLQNEQCIIINPTPRTSLRVNLLIVKHSSLWNNPPVSCAFHHHLLPLEMKYIKQLLHPFSSIYFKHIECMKLDRVFGRTSISPFVHVITWKSGIRSASWILSNSFLTYSFLFILGNLDLLTPPLTQSQVLFPRFPIVSILFWCHFLTFP